jgi:hypothetical protein
MEIAAARAQQGSLDRAARRFVVLLGFVSLFGDMTYEGARSIIGPYLATLGASATVVGIAAGFGELVGYTVRLLSDYIGDRTGRYWMAPPERRGTAFGLFQTVFGVAWFHWQRPAWNYLRPLHACGLCSFTRSPAACFACFVHPDDDATDAITKAITSGRARPRSRSGA